MIFIENFDVLYTDLGKGLFLFSCILLTCCHDVDWIGVDDSSHTPHVSHLVVSSPLIVVSPGITIIISSPGYIVCTPSVGRIGICPVIVAPAAVTATVSPSVVRIDWRWLWDESTPSVVVGIVVGIIIVYSSPNIVTVISWLV